MGVLLCDNKVKYDPHESGIARKVVAICARGGAAGSKRVKGKG